MDLYLPLILDGLTFLFVLILVLISAHRGFVRSVINLAGYLAAFVVASFASTAAAQAVYGLFLRGALLRFFEGSLGSMVDTDALAQGLGDSIQALPDILVNALRFDAGNIAANLGGYLEDSAAGMALSVVDGLVGPTLVMLLRGMLFILFFFLAMFAVGILARASSGLRHVPVIGSVNAFLGGAVGFLMAVLFITVFVLAARVVSAATNNGIAWLSPGVLRQTFFLGFFLDRNPLLALLSFLGVSAR